MIKRRMKLTKEEKRIEGAVLRREYKSVPKEEFERIKKALDARKKDAVLNLRINSNDLENLKRKAAKMGVKYRTFIAEILHSVAMG